MNITYLTNYFLPCKRKYFFVLTISCLFFSSSFAQGTIFKHLDVNDGLPKNTVLSIAQDAQGFMWFCTPDGLTRFDSRKFKTYLNDPLNTNSISYNWTTSLLCDSYKTLWIGTFNGLNKYNPETDSFQQLFHDPTNSNSLSNHRIYCIYEDRSGTKWIGTENGLNQLIDTKQNRFKRFLYTENKTPTTKKLIVTVFSICEDHDNNLWLATNTGLIRISFHGKSVAIKVFRHFDKINNSISDNVLSAVVCDKNNTIWVTTKNGELERFDATNESFTHCLKKHGLVVGFNELNCLNIDNKGYIWIGMTQGAIKLDPATMKFSLFQNEPNNFQSLSDDSVYSIFEDRQKSIWLGTYASGINVTSPIYTPFKTLLQKNYAKVIINRTVHSIIEDKLNNLWVKGAGSILDYIIPKTASQNNLKIGTFLPADISSQQVSSIFVDQLNYTWIGMRKGGIFRVNSDHTKYKFFRYNIPDSSLFSAGFMRSMLEDSQHRFWIAFAHALYLFDKNKGTFQRYSLEGGYDSSVELVPVIFEDSKSDIWIGGRGGVYHLDNKTNQFKWNSFKKVNNVNDRPNQVNCIHEDAQQRLWVGTSYGGLKRLDPTHNNFINYGLINGIAEHTVTAIRSDKKGLLWVGTNHGLIQYNPTTKRSYQYTNADGIPGNEVMFNASCQGTDGVLYFGMNKGLLYFSPDSIKINYYSPKVVFTGLEVVNKEVNVNDKSNILVKNISHTDNLTFNYWQNFFTVSFALLNYIKSDKNLFAYKLKGVDREWHYIKDPSISFTNLSSGTYTLLVKGANNDGIWTPGYSQLRLVILPPWWRSGWAYGVYGLLFGFVLYVTIRFFWIRERYKQEHKLHQFKLEFFTNISHEIRTNLTLIAGPIDFLLNSQKDNQEVQKQLIYTKNNSDRLLTLVSELMDFRKAESNELQLRVSQNEVISFLKNSMTLFQHSSEQSNISFTLANHLSTDTLWFDPVQLQKVVHNLLSNAFKSTPESGAIQLSTVESVDWVAIMVSDTGSGISELDVKNVFTNYFQGNNTDPHKIGFGIGLALSRRIAELQGGTLTVVSKEARDGINGFTCFLLKLRKGHSHFTKEQLVDSVSSSFETGFESCPTISPPVEALENNLERTILLVEDNEELRSFIKAILSRQYQIIEADNGQLGWEIALDVLPDLIISDIMMKELNGLDLCRQLKADERTNHIPVILLTAKAGFTHQLSGLEAGADMYITKPLNVPLLELSLRNIFFTQAVMRQKYSQHITIEPQNLTINTDQKDFILKLTRIVEANLSVKGFVVETLANQVNMSKPVLYKKLKALTDLSVNEFIKLIRLKKASQLLREGNYNTNEVSLIVGFEDRRYFSREFKKVFGMNPSEYAKKD